MTKIIVVDDDQTNVGLLKMLLELEGFEVVSCTDIPQAKTAAASDVKAFLVDCHLARGASGVDLLNDIRKGATDAPKDCVIVMASGDHRLEEPTKAAGANLFLLKPFPPHELSGYLNSLLGEG